ncbi:MAG: hypothetical protein ACLPN1_10980 [Dissulfurispiraceae bacterium]|jgi:hypothetical protein
MLTNEQAERMKKEIREEMIAHYKSPEMQAAFEALINAVHKYEAGEKSSKDSMTLMEATCDLFVKHVEYLKTNSIDSIVKRFIREN